MIEVIPTDQNEHIAKLSSENRSERVNALFRLCFFGAGNPNFDYSTIDPRNPETFPDDLKQVHGILNTFGLSKKRLEEYKVRICKELADMKDEFFDGEGGGGGYSFLALAFDKYEQHWAEHPTMEQLVVLGMGLDLVILTLPREMWPSLPGGMPYFIFKNEIREIAKGD